MNIVTLVNELKAEKQHGEDMVAQMVDRIDKHIRDLELLKAWAKDVGAARSMTLGGMLYGDAPAPAAEPLPPQDEAA